MQSHISGNTPLEWQHIEVFSNDKNFKNIKNLNTTMKKNPTKQRNPSQTDKLEKCLHLMTMNLIGLIESIDRYGGQQTHLLAAVQNCPKPGRIIGVSDRNNVC